MAIYVKGQDLELQLRIPMRILKAFAVEDMIYYIVWIRDGKMKSVDNGPMYAVFRHDDSNGYISPEILQMADQIVAKENLLEGLG